MYHGQVVPGFPRHPHRGFETVTITRRGFIDHADSLGVAARYGEGDVRWMTAGAGIVHSEMFPLLHGDRPDPAELFQVWLNLPRADKFVDPYFTMLWNPDIPRIVAKTTRAARTQITVIADSLDGASPPSPAPNSWAARAEADVAIWTVRLELGAEWTMPPAASADTVRVLYVHTGGGLQIAGQQVDPRHVAVVRADVALPIVAGEVDAEFLLLQGRPIGEPVEKYGPFAMNDRAGIEQAFTDYQRTQFGGWPWPADDPVHGPERTVSPATPTVGSKTSPQAEKDPQRPM